MADYSIARKRPTETDASDKTITVDVNGTSVSITCDGSTANTLTPGQVAAFDTSRWTVTAL